MIIKNKIAGIEKTLLTSPILLIKGIKIRIEVGNIWKVINRFSRKKKKTFKKSWLLIKCLYLVITTIKIKKKNKFVDGPCEFGKSVFWKKPRR